MVMALVLLGCGGKEAVRGQSPGPEEAFRRANEYLQKGRYEEARDLLQEARARDATGKIAPLAELRLADSYLKEGEPEQAIRQYERFLRRYPEHRYAPYAQYQIGMVHFSQIEDPERGYGAAKAALEAFQRLQARYPRNPYRKVLPARVARCRDIIARYEFLVGQFYFKRQAWQGAIGRLEGLLRDYPEFAQEAQVLYMLALSYQALGKRDRAWEYFKALREKYPDSRLAKKVEEKLR